MTKWIVAAIALAGGVALYMLMPPAPVALAWNCNSPVRADVITFTSTGM